MAADTFTPPVKHSFPMDDSREPKLRIVPFGDGFNMRQPDGLNHDLEEDQVVWDNLTEAEATTIFNYLVGKGGWDHFWYTMYWESTSPVAKLYYAPKYGRSRTEAGAWKVTAVLKQVVEAA